MLWRGQHGKEIGRLAQGLEGVVEGTETMKFIKRDDVPADRKKDVAHVRIVCDVRPEKEDKYRVRVTVAGNLINYPGNCGTPTADLLTVKLLFNSVISTPGAKFFNMDISNFYLNTPLPRKEYLRMKLAHFDEKVIQQYKLREIATDDGWVYIEVSKGIYGLP